jgi:hypothetical protein
LRRAPFPTSPAPAALTTQLLAGLALLALYVALDQVMTLPPLRAGVQA